jgi:aminoglycoside 6-adenylyltransferase
VYAAVVVGSRARQDHPADEYSDLDLILYVSDDTDLASSRAWLAQLGQVWAAALGQAGPDPEWLVIFAGGVKADFVLAPVNDPAAQRLSNLLAASPHGLVIQRGLRVLVDKLGRGPHPIEGNRPDVPVISTEPLSHPEPLVFSNAIEQFLVAASRTAKLVRRADLWRAKMACDCELKGYLLEMLGWHARAVHGLQRDTWNDGRFIQEWADKRALAELPEAFGDYSQAGLKRALLATLSLYSWLGRTTAERLGYSYPEGAEGPVWGYIGALLGELPG